MQNGSSIGSAGVMMLAFVVTGNIVVVVAIVVVDVVVVSFPSNSIIMFRK